MTGTRGRILHLLKTKGPRSAATLAKRLKITAMAVRQHLATLEEEGMVGFDEERRGVGRPRRIWRLTAAAQARFPDSHGELTVGMLEAIRSTFGEEGIERLIAERTRAQARAYRARIPKGPLDKRVAALAAIRNEEGYMAEWSRSRDGTLTLVENHCPICAAAEACQGLCAGEIALFSAVLGRGVAIERVEHILSGARRCVYRIGTTR